MEPKRVKKFVLKKETISNLSNFEQSRIIGGYNEGPSKFWWNTICAFVSAFGLPEYSCFFNETDCPGDLDCGGDQPSTKDDGGTCDSSVDMNISCQGYCW